MRTIIMSGVIAGLLTVAPTGAGAATGFAGVWRPGTGAQWWQQDMSLATFKAQDKAYFDKGLRLQSLSIRDGRYTAEWRPGTGTQWWQSDKSLAEIKAQDDIYFKQGLRITAMEVDNGRYAAVWRPGTGAQWWQADMSLATFKAKDKAHFDNGLRLTVLEVDNGRYTAVWRPGTGAQWWASDKTGPQIEALDKDYFDKGLRLTALAVDGGRYAAVWRPGSGAQWWRRHTCLVDFKSQDSKFFGDGLRLSFIELEDSGASPYRYPWKSGVALKVGQGNNNAGGSHTGSQAFAFDFMMPSGTTIRAAAAGTVEWLQEGQTTTYNPNAPTTASNTPFPAGSLQNWGNAVRIRHFGGMTSWYFHIQPNGVIVNVGDTVERGQPIATSDNTGRTTGPHLHFQIQADSTNWGQSVAASFGDCQVPKTNDTVTSNNSNSSFP